MISRKNYESTIEMNRNGTVVQERRADEVRKNFAIGLKRVVTVNGPARGPRVKTGA